MNFIKQFGALTVASRMRAIIEQMTQDISAIYAEEDINFEPRWYTMVALLAQSPSLPIGEIADALGITHAAVNQFAKELSTQGYLTSQQCSQDKRKRRLTLTDKGRAVFLSLQPIVANVGDSAQAILDATGYDVLAMLDALEDSLQSNSFYERYRRRKQARLVNDITILNSSEMTLSQFEIFKNMNTRWLEHLYALEAEDKRYLNDPIDNIVKAGGQLWVAQVNGTVVGTIALFKNSLNAYEIAYFVVDNLHRNQHMGTTLLASALTWAIQQGIETVSAYVAPQLTPAIHLYRQFGFQQLDITNNSPSASPYKRFPCHYQLELAASASPVSVSMSQKASKPDSKKALSHDKRLATRPS